MQRSIVLISAAVLLVVACNSLSEVEQRDELATTLVADNADLDGLVSELALKLPAVVYVADERAVHDRRVAARLAEEKSTGLLGNVTAVTEQGTVLFGGSVEPAVEAVREVRAGRRGRAFGITEHGVTLQTPGPASAEDVRLLSVIVSRVAEHRRLALEELRAVVRTRWPHMAGTVAVFDRICLTCPTGGAFRHLRDSRHSHSGVALLVPSDYVALSHSGATDGVFVYDSNSPPFDELLRLLRLHTTIVWPIRLEV